MSKPANMFHLTQKEARAIYYWLKRKNYKTDTNNTFKIIFESQQSNKSILVLITQNGITKQLKVNIDLNDRVKSIDTLQLGKHILDLSIDEKYQAAVNNNNESGSSFAFEVSKGICEIYVSDRSIGKYPLAEISRLKIKPAFRLTYMENLILLKDIKVQWPILYQSRVPFFLAEDMAILVERLYLYGYKVHGIECWSSKDVDFFGVEVWMDGTPDDGWFIDGWFIDAYYRLLQKYTEMVLPEEPDNPPMFELSVCK